MTKEVEEDVNDRVDDAEDAGPKEQASADKNESLRKRTRHADDGLTAEQRQQQREENARIAAEQRELIDA